MNTGRTFLLSIFLSTMTFILLRPTPLLAQFEPSDNVTLTMYRLVQPSGDRTDDLCTKDDPAIARSYGCTAITDNPTYAYPFDSSTITISIDGSNGPDNNRYVYPYLWDVVPQELDMNGSQGNKPLAAVKAQAIAARTYIYQRMTYLDQYGTPNNSTQFHVFLPYRYAALTAAQKVRVQAAAADRVYLTEADSTYPIEALYGADNPVNTVAGNRPYLKSVADPINAAYGVSNGTGNGGMSSKGASRWSFGHTSSRGPVAATHPNYPHDDGGNGDFWSVRWDEAFQILTHYYTGVHLRDANANNAILTPTYRWVPLRIDAPANTCVNTDVPVQLWLQNTGTTDWAANAVISVITNIAATPASVTQLQSNAIPETVSAGADVVITRMVRPTFAGTFAYSIDLFTSAVGLFSGQTPNWPRYEQVTIAAADCNARVYMPLVQAGAPAAGQ